MDRIMGPWLTKIIERIAARLTGVEYDLGVNRLVFSAVIISGVGVVAASQPLADVTRRERAIDTALVFAPDGKMLRAATLDQHEPVADLLWIRTVLVFGERWNADPDPTWITWLRGSIYAVSELDPRWRTPYFWGGSLLRILDDIEGSDAVFLAGIKNLPDDYYFPFSYGMNLYLYHDDAAGAAGWIELASRLPNGVPKYAGLAAKLRSTGGDRSGAIAYLLERKQEATDDTEIADLDLQLGHLYHDRLVDELMPSCKAYRAAKGQAPLSSADFFAWANIATPDNPRGDAWIIGTDGCVRSASAETARIRRLRTAERSYLR
jgi:hypothetical protein